MALFDEKFYLEVLQGHVSEDTKKARRNLAMIGFVLSGIDILGFSLQDLHIFGLSMEKKAGIGLAWLAGALLTYWFVIYILQFLSDREVNAEKRHLLFKTISHNEDKFYELKEKESEQKLAQTRHPLFFSEQVEPLTDFQEREKYVAGHTTYLDQKERTGLAKWLLSVTGMIQATVPFLLGGYAYRALYTMLST